MYILNVRKLTIRYVSLAVEFLKRFVLVLFLSLAKLRKRCNTAIEGVENIVWATKE